MKKNILILAGYYSPSVKAGGPIQSIKNLVDNLHQEANFYVLALDRDKGDSKGFSNISTETWTPVGNAKVFYVESKKLTWRKLISIMNSRDFSAIYLNSFFDVKLSIMPVLLKRLNLVKTKRMIIAPRGNFSSGALNLKYFKKRALIQFTKILKTHDQLIWHATAIEEKEDIKKVFGYVSEENIKVSNNLTANYQNLEFTKSLYKEKNSLKIAFISRIHPKKNLLSAIKYLKFLEGDVIFSVYGPIEDKEYWEECKRLVEKLPENVKFSYHGVINNEEVVRTFNQQHVFLFPTLGENFGHVISEALIGGCPVIISEETPWRFLKDKNVGWDINLQNDEMFIEALKYYLVLEDKEYNNLAKRAFEYGKMVSNKREDIDKYYDLFNL